MAGRGLSWVGGRGVKPQPRNALGRALRPDKVPATVPGSQHGTVPKRQKVFFSVTAHSRGRPGCASVWPAPVYWSARDR